MGLGGSPFLTDNVLLSFDVYVRYMESSTSEEATLKLTLNHSYDSAAEPLHSCSITPSSVTDLSVSEMQEGSDYIITFNTENTLKITGIDVTFTGVDPYFYYQE